MQGAGDRAAGRGVGKVTFEEAKKVARIAGKADGGCANCVRHLVEELNKEFPEFVWDAPEDAEYTDHNVTVVPHV